MAELVEYIDHLQLDVPRAVQDILAPDAPQKELSSVAAHRSKVIEKPNGAYVSDAAAVVPERTSSVSKTAPPAARASLPRLIKRVGGPF